jgi:hypothetical protein
MGAGDRFSIRVPGMRVADGNDIRGLFAEVKTHTRRKGVGDDNSLVASDTETRMT